ncbi:MAG: LytTR family transcriptional regulator DNA-binding domain-containing protein [Firmicutes bacterium]|nr:LytTR family transcriptional regulator DNA-binding domain-containing protein [Bacillota bacterium]
MKQIIIVEDNEEVKNWFIRNLKKSQPFSSITFVDSPDEIENLLYDESVLFFVNEKYKNNHQVNARYLIIHTYDSAKKTCSFALYVRRPKESLQEIYNEIHLHRDISDVITLPDQKETTSILIKEILFIERIKRYSLIHTPNHVYSTKLTFNDLLPMLPDSFSQTHRSYIVNFYAVREFIRTDFILENNDYVPISRNYSKTVEQKWNHFFQIYVKNSL